VSIGDSGNHEERLGLSLKQTQLRGGGAFTSRRLTGENHPTSILSEAADWNPDWEFADEYFEVHARAVSKRAVRLCVETINKTGKIHNNITAVN